MRTSIAVFLFGTSIFMIQINTRPIDFSYSGHTVSYDKLESQSKLIQKEILGEELFDIMTAIDNKVPLSFWRVNKIIRLCLFQLSTILKVDRFSMPFWPSINFCSFRFKNLIQLVVPPSSMNCNSDPGINAEYLAYFRPLLSIIDDEKEIYQIPLRVCNHCIRYYRFFLAKWIFN